jgi:GGDEF domain-containing protein
MAYTAHPTEQADESLDPLTGFGNREQLIADLAAALQPRSPPRILAVFDLFGMDEYRRVFGERGSNDLTGRLAVAFAHVVKHHGTCYRTRKDEFCALLAGATDADEADEILHTAARALWDVGESLQVGSWYGVCSLPDEVADPVEALMLADERLLTRGNRTPRERRHDQRGTRH